MEDNTPLLDSQTIISDITDTNSCVSIDVNETICKLKLQLETALNKLTVDILKETCKEMNISSKPQKKGDIVQVLLTEYTQLCERLKDKKTNELKNICKCNKIKCILSSKKNVLLISILEHALNTMSFFLDKTIVEPVTKTNEPVTKTPEPVTKSTEPITKSIEELEKQRISLDLQMKEALEHKKMLDEEAKCNEEKKRAEDQKKLEKEEAKRKKQSIPKQIRNIVWNHYIGDDIIKHKCLSCKKVSITNTSFDVGHVISEHNGGTHEINNLRPICGACNHSMGTDNMVDFVVKYGLYIG
jgi:hypothetical protein